MSTKEQAHTAANLAGDLSVGHYAATCTVATGRRNLFDLSEANSHHIGTLIGGSKSKLQRFDEDCDKIVRGLAALDTHDELVAALSDVLAFAEALEKYSGKGTGGRRGGTIFAKARAALARAALARAKGAAK